MPEKTKPIPAKNLDEWLKIPGRSIEQWSGKAMLHQATWYHARLKDNSVTVSVGMGAKPEHARIDAWQNLPAKRR